MKKNTRFQVGNLGTVEDWGGTGKDDERLKKDAVTMIKG